MNRRCLLLALIPTLLLGPSAPAPSALPGVTQRVSVSSSGEQGDYQSYWGLITADGRCVVFSSHATNLVPGDTNWLSATRPGADVFVRNRVTGTTERVSITTAGEQLPGTYWSWADSVSPDGRYVGMVFAHAGSWDIHLRDRLLGTTEAVAVCSPIPSGGAHVSVDGRYVGFSTMAPHLVPDDTNECCDVFVRDRVAGTTKRVSVNSLGDEGNDDSFCGSPSADGRYIVFNSMATNLVPGGRGMQVYLRDQAAGTIELISASNTGESANADSGFPVISPDGRYVLFSSDASDLVPGDTNDWWDVFLRDRLQGTTERVSLSSSGEQGSSPGDVEFMVPFGGISADGRYVVFHSDAVGLVPADTDDLSQVFLRDRVAGTTEVVSVTIGGEPAYAQLPSSITADGRCIGFNSRVHDLVPADTNDCRDVFVWDMDARFHDVPSCYWAFPHIEACVTAEFVKGYDDNTYHPKYDVSRAQMAVYISRSLAGGDGNVPDGPGEATFDDVPTGHWAFKYIEYCVAEDMVQGFDPDTYGPTVTVARDAMAVFISRAVAGGDAGVPDGPADATFDDVPTDHWAFKYVEYCVANGIVEGYDADTYVPAGTVSRAQMAVFISRSFDLL